MKTIIIFIIACFVSISSIAGNNFNMVTHSFQPHPTFPNTYIIVLEAVIPCNGGIAPDSIDVNCEWGGAMTFSTIKKLNKVSENVLSTSPTIGITTTCQVANSAVAGFRVVSYFDTISAIGALISVTYKDCNRANFSNMDTTCVTNRMWKSNELNQESNIGSTRVLYMYADSTMQYNMNVTDLEGDSTSIKLVNPADTMQAWGSFVYQHANYKNGYSFTEPLGISTSAVITDTFLNITSHNPGVYLLTVFIEDFDTTVSPAIPLSKSLNDFVIVVMPSLATRIDNIDLSKITINPNPIINQLNIDELKDNDELQISNQLGQVVFKTKYHHATHVIIPVEYLTSGLYFIQVSRGDKHQVLKFLKN